MKENKISETALKVAYGLVSLSAVDEWSERLPPGLADMSERLVLASGARGYGPRLLRAARRRWMVRVHRLQDRLMPGQWEGFGHRKIFMQRHVERAIEQGARQVLVLGAGFDTLCLRLAPEYPDVRFVEVDHPATSAAKAKGIRAEGQPDNMHQIAADLGERLLSQVLLHDDRWNETTLTAVVAEGLLLYLTDDQVCDLFTELHACVPKHSEIAFSHKIPDGRKVLPALVRLVGEPFRSEVRSEDLPGYLEETGWRVLSDVDTDAAHGIERYGVAERV